MVPRFYAPALSPGRGVVELPAEEAHHLLHVMRLSEGDPVRLFDGRGLEVLARVRRSGRGGVVAEVVGPAEPRPEPAVRVALLLGLLKGGHMDGAVRDATMLGVSSVHPARTAHTVVPQRAMAGARAVARWRRLAVAAAKQCGRAVVPEIADLRPFDAWLEAPWPAARLLLVEPAVEVDGRADLESLAKPARRHGAVVAVGPEGGWAAGEVARARAAGFVPWSLGPMTLRADAVPVAALSVLQYAWGRALTA